MIAINKPMPKSCAERPCEHDAACYVEGYRRPITLSWLERQEKREEWCPLIDLTDDGKQSTIGQAMSKLQASYFEVVTKYYEVGCMPITGTAAEHFRKIRKMMVSVEETAAMMEG